MTERIEFKPPQGFSAPEGTEAGGEFDMVCTFRVKDNGDICLVQLGDVKMPGYDGSDGHKPGYGDMAKSMMQEKVGGGY